MKIIECDQYSSPYWSARCGVPTASNFGKILTPVDLAPSEQASGYINELIADTFDSLYPRNSEYATAAMRAGTANEPEVRNLYAFDTGFDVRQVGFVLSDD